MPLWIDALDVSLERDAAAFAQPNIFVLDLVGVFGGDNDGDVVGSEG